MGEYPDEERPLLQPGEGGAASEEAKRAAWQARRMMEASRGLLTGNLALHGTIAGSVMVMMDYYRGDPMIGWLGALVFLAAGAWFWFSYRLVSRLRAADGVMVSDDVETYLNESSRQRIRRMVKAYAIVLTSMVGWMALFRWVGMAAGIGIVIAGLAGVFIYRSIRFRFWEDLVFAASIAAAWGLFLAHEPGLAPLAFVPPLAVIAGMVCLQLRWRRWARSVPKLEAEAS